MMRFGDEIRPATTYVYIRICMIDSSLGMRVAACLPLPCGKERYQAVNGVETWIGVIWLGPPSLRKVDL